MKKTLYMAQSLNGLICRSNDKADFVSDEEWEKGYNEAANEAGIIIVGGTTYDVMKEYEDFDMLPDDLVCIVVASSPKELSPNHYQVNSPQKALNKAQELGFNHVLIAGGTKLNSSFLQEKLVDEIVLDVEPILVAEGKNLFSGEFEDVSLSFVEMKKLTDDLVQLHYKVNA